MQVPVPKRPSPTTLARLIVGNPASGRNARDWISGLAHLTGYVVTPVASQAFKLVTTVPQTHYVAYKKRPGVHLLRITVETAAGTADGSRGTLAITAIDSAGAAATTTWLGGAHTMDGTQQMPAMSAVLRDYPTLTAWLDVSALTAGSWYDLVCTWTNTATSRGLALMHVVECPLASGDPLTASTEPGADLTWARARQGITDGSATGPRGMQRLLGQEDVARAQCPRQGIQIEVPEDSATPLSWAVTATAAGTVIPFGMGSNPIWRIRARALYGTSVANTYSLRLRYKNSDATGAPWKCTFRVAVTPVGAGATNTDFQLTNQTAWGARTTDSGAAAMTVSIPASGTGQVCKVSFAAWNDTAAKTTWISQVALAELEA